MPVPAPHKRSPLKAVSSTHPLKSPFATGRFADQRAYGGASLAPRSAKELRREQVSLFEMYVRATTSKRGRPYSESSIRCFTEAVGSLMNYLDEVDFGGECHEITYVELNGYLAAYRRANSHGGVVTKLGNLRQFFAWLTDEYDLPENAYNHRKRDTYSRHDIAPPELSVQFLKDLLATCSDGKHFMDLRDLAILRMFYLGPRIGEVEAMQVEDLDLRNKVVKIRPFKMSDEWRVVPLPIDTPKLLASYLRARAALGFPASQGDLWISWKRKQPMTQNGIRQMLTRRIEQAGYPVDHVHPHLIRHTMAGLAKEQNLTTEQMMALFGWKDPTMAQRYGRSQRQERAVAAARAVNFGVL